MSQATNLRDLWAQGRPSLNGWLSIPSAVSAEMMAYQGWDSLTLDLQHGLIGYEAALSMLQGIGNTPVAPLARLPWAEPGIAMKLLDAGAVGVIAPMTNSAEEAERLVSMCRYPPVGFRSVGPTRAALADPSHVETANGEVLVFAMVETSQSLKEVDAIAATSGLDGIYVGPADLALSMGRDSVLDPEDRVMTEAFGAIVKAAENAGIVAALHCGSAAYAGKAVEWGFKMVTVQSDARILQTGAAELVKNTRDQIG